MLRRYRSCPHAVPVRLTRQLTAGWTGSCRTTFFFRRAYSGAALIRCSSGVPSLSKQQAHKHVSIPEFSTLNAAPLLVQVSRLIRERELGRAAT